MIEGKTKSGFKYSIDERILSDWRMLEAIHASESKDASEQLGGITQLTDLLLGKNKSKFMEHIAKKNDGFVPSEVVTSEITEMFTQVKELKNSQSSQE